MSTIQVVKLLLAAGANVNAADSEGRTALIASAYMGHADIVATILEYDADINQPDSDGRTALSVAALCVPSSDGYAKVNFTAMVLHYVAMRVSHNLG